jgi:hypothetical protein
MLKEWQNICNIMVIMVQLVLYMTNMQHKKVSSQSMHFVGWLKRILAIDGVRNDKPPNNGQDLSRGARRLDGLETREPYDSTNLRWRGGAL